MCRPSGTEDLVRVFAEAESNDAAEKLAIELQHIVFEHCGGVETSLS
jgi:phosphoacetylglucosamine mutase